MQAVQHTTIKMNSSNDDAIDAGDEIAIEDAGELVSILMAAAKALGLLPHEKRKHRYVNTAISLFHFSMMTYH